MGWFGSFNDVGHHQLVVVVMLAAPSKSVSGGGMAAGIAGSIYKNLFEQQYFAEGGVKQKGMPEISATYPCCQK